MQKSTSWLTALFICFNLMIGGAIGAQSRETSSVQREREMVMTWIEQHLVSHSSPFFHFFTMGKIGIVPV